MKKILLIALLGLMAANAANAQVFTSKKTVALSLNGGYISDGATAGLEVAYYPIGKPLYLFAGANYTFRTPFEGHKQNDLILNIGAGWTIPIKKDRGWSISPFVGAAYDKLSVSNVKLSLEDQFNFGVVYGAQIEKSFKNTWTIGLFGKQLNTLTGDVKINDFYGGITIKKSFNTFRFNR